MLRLFTQNIDCLEREAGVPDDKIVEAHGSFATQRCIECRTPYADKKMKAHIKRKEVPRCLQGNCGGLVKPDIVFFGEQLPAKFFQEREMPAKADLCFVMGTSLTVQPFASLPSFVGEGVPRVLVNLERVGSLGGRSDDVLVLGDCDEGVRKIADACGWLQELEDEWASTVNEPAEAETHVGDKSTDLKTAENKDAALEAEVDKLTREVDETLRISADHIDRVLAEHGGKNLPINGDKAQAYTGQKLQEALPEKGKEKEKKQENANGRFAAEGKNGGDEMPIAERINQDVTNPSGQEGLNHVYPHIKKSAL